LDSLELALVSGLIPGVAPVGGADTRSILPVGLALLIVIASLLQANEPFIVTIPTVESLVMRGESFVTRSGAGVLDLVQEVFLFLGERRNLVTEDLVELWSGDHGRSA
jgi:hypothetical protein